MSRKRGGRDMPKPRQLASLKPIRPGEVRNPEGRNQYTYRRDFQDAIQRLADGTFVGRDQACSDRAVVCGFCGLPGCERAAAGLGAIHTECLAAVRGMKGGEVLAHVAWRQALSGDQRMLPEVLKRFWTVEEAQSSEVDQSLSAQLDAMSKRVGEDL